MSGRHRVEYVAQCGADTGCSVKKYQSLSLRSCAVSWQRSMRGVALVLLEGVLGRETLAAGAAVLLAIIIKVSCGFLVLVQRHLRRESLVASETGTPVLLPRRRHTVSFGFLAMFQRHLRRESLVAFDTGTPILLLRRRHRVSFGFLVIFQCHFRRESLVAFVTDPPVRRRFGRDLLLRRRRHDVP